MLPDLDHRDRQPELMDQPGLDVAVHRYALASMGRVNRISFTARVIWRGLADLLDLSSTRRYRVLDIACGGGDLALRLNHIARRRGIALQADGCDVSPTSVAFASDAARRNGIAGARFFQLDALRDALPPDYDVLMCTLFLHHLEETDVVSLLNRMAASARRAVLVDDLVRTRFGYVLAWAGGRLLTRSPIIHTDGPLSVRAAFGLDEFRGLAARAGLEPFTIRRHWPQRFLMTWSKA